MSGNENELIAQFMGLKPYEDSRYGTMWPHPITKQVGFGNKYHESWDWLMPVVEKIGDDYRIEIVAGAYVRITSFPMPTITTNVALEGGLSL